MNTAQLAEQLAMEVPTCPLAVIRDMIRWAQRELCTEGNIWIVRSEPVVVAADTAFAELEVPYGTEAIRIIRLKDGNGRVMRPDVDYWQVGPGEVEFKNNPKVTSIFGELACRPLLGEDIPDTLISRWAEALMDGARYRLFMLPQPWRDPNLADFHRRRFMDCQADARSIARDGYQYGSMRMRTRRMV